MALLKNVLKADIERGFKAIFKEQSAKATSDGAEQEDPNKIIDDICDKMSRVVAEAVDSYVKGGDIIVGPQNIVVAAPNGSCVVSPAEPAKIV